MKKLSDKEMARVQKRQRAGDPLPNVNYKKHKKSKSILS
jgi:hypothetical protein